MGQEIERKFLVKNERWRGLAEGVLYRQGYLCTERSATVRVRIAGDQGYLTIKGPPTGITRAEYEYPIPVQDALAMLEILCPQPQIEKKRYTISYQGMRWEVDEFFGSNQGLIVAEIELSSEDQAFTRPDWVGREVTDDHRYANAALCRKPFTTWPSQEQ